MRSSLYSRTPVRLLSNRTIRTLISLQAARLAPTVAAPPHAAATNPSIVGRDLPVRSRPPGRLGCFHRCVELGGPIKQPHIARSSSTPLSAVPVILCLRRTIPPAGPRTAARKKGVQPQNMPLRRRLSVVNPTLLIASIPKITIARFIQGMIICINLMALLRLIATTGANDQRAVMRIGSHLGQRHFMTKRFDFGRTAKHGNRGAIWYSTAESIW
jgi:hypothetical protein